MIRDYRSKIESKLSNICDRILKLLDIDSSPPLPPMTPRSAAVENEELTVEERNLLSVAYKNVIGTR